MIISHDSVRDSRYKTKSKGAYIKEKVMQELVLKVTFFLKLLLQITHIYKFSLPFILAAIVQNNIYKFDCDYISIMLLLSLTVT